MGASLAESASKNSIGGVIIILLRPAVTDLTLPSAMRANVFVRPSDVAKHQSSTDQPTLLVLLVINYLGLLVFARIERDQQCPVIVIGR